MTGFQREELIRALPYARRYARALTGSQQSGDALVAGCLAEALGQAPGREDMDAVGEDALHALYAWVTARFDRDGGAPAGDDGMPARQRQLLLLTTLEDLSVENAAPILGLSVTAAQLLLDDARARLRATAATDVLIIEDEPIIAMDLCELVESCGHRVVGVAVSEAEAVAMAARTQPGLILADINLGSGGDGTRAVSKIMRGNVTPVIFVTAYPERLLTGEALEPAFVITKPFEPLTLAIAIYQAVSGKRLLQGV
jgi:CheY-like chemotaxis protein